MSIFGITSADFVGEFKISSDSYTSGTLQQYIDDNELELLYDLLGVELTDLLIADLSGGVPQSPIYQAIFNAFAEDVKNTMCNFFWWNGRTSFEFWDYCCCGDRDKRYYQSKGIIYYIKTMVWFRYVRDYVGVPGVKGNSRSKTTNSQGVSYTSHFICAKHQKGVSTARAIQWYCMENKDDYPDFKGSRIDDILPF